MQTLFWMGFYLRLFTLGSATSAIFAQIYFINTYLEWYFVKVPYICSTLNIHIFDQRKQFLKNSRENILPHRTIRKLHSVSLKYSFLRTGNTTSKMVLFVKTSYSCRPLATIVTTSFILDVAAALDPPYDDIPSSSLQVLQILND